MKGGRTYQILFTLDFAGTLCARDGIKTGLGTPNGEDSYDRKLGVMRRKKTEDHYYYHHKCSCDIREVAVCPCMGAERNTNASNDNPLIVKVRRRITKPTFNRTRNEVFGKDDVAQCLCASPNMSPINNRTVIVKSYGMDPVASYDLSLDKEVSKTLTCSHGRNGAGVLTKAKKEREVFPINSMVIGKDGGNGDRQTFGVGEEGDPIPTIGAAHHHAVAVIRRQK